MPEAIPISEACRILRDRHSVATSYQVFWRGVASGELPAEKVRGQWRISRADLPAIAATLAA